MKGNFVRLIVFLGSVASEIYIIKKLKDIHNEVKYFERKKGIGKSYNGSWN